MRIVFGETQAALAEYNELSMAMEINVVWLRLKVFWLSEDDSKGDSERKMKRLTEDEVGRQYKNMDRDGLSHIKTKAEGNCCEVISGAPKTLTLTRLD